MSLALYSVKAKEATKLKDNGYEISVGENDNGTQQIQFIREDGKDVKFNNIYNKKEIDDMALGKNFNLDTFYQREIYKGGTIRKFKTDGTSIPASASTLENLYANLRDSVQNLETFLQTITNDKYAKDATLEIFNKPSENSSYTITTEDVSTPTKLITALNTNSKNLQNVISELNGIEFKTIDDYLNKDVISESDLTEIELDELHQIYYLQEHKTITKFKELVQYIQTLGNRFKEMVYADDETELKILKETETDGTKKYELENTFTQTFSKLITDISKSNEALFNYINSIKIPGIDFNGKLTVIDKKNDSVVIPSTQPTVYETNRKRYNKH